MRIVILVKELSLGGAEKQALILSHLLSTKHSVDLYSFNNNVEEKFSKYINEKSINITFFNGNVIKKIYSLYSKLKNNKVDLVFSYLLTANMLGSIVGYAAGVTYRIGGIRNAKLSSKKAFIERFLHNYLNTKTVFNNYSGFEHYIKKGFKEEKAIVIPNGIKVPTRKFKKQITGPIKIITVGRLVEQKDYITAISVIRTLVNMGCHNIHYTIVGYGSLEITIKNTIENENLGSTISLLINPSDLNSLYKDSDIYLCTSLFEGISNTILEAMSYGLPIVATNVGDNNYLVEHNHNGYLAERQNISELADALLKLIDNPELRNKFGRDSYHKVKNNYSEEKLNANYINLIAELDK